MMTNDEINALAVKFIEEHPDWELILDNDNDVLMIVSPFYRFSRTVTEDECPNS